MQIPPEIAFQHVEPSEDIRALIAEKIAHLEKIHDGIISAHIQIRAPHQRQKTGNLFSVTIELRVPGKALVVRKSQGDSTRHVHLRATLRDGFAAMEGELRRWKDSVQGTVKSHDGPLQGRIAQLDPSRGFGQILATDHRLIYFHENSVIDGRFDELAQGDAVELVVQNDESAIGPQASTVRRINTLSFDPATKPSRR